MKMKSAVLAMAMASGAIASGIMPGACGSGTTGQGGNGGAGGSSQSGGSSGSGGSKSSGGSANSGGNSASGGATSPSGGGAGGSAGSSGTGATCTATADVKPCGGSVTGTWTVTSGCLQISGPVNAQAVFGLTCPTVQVTGSLQVTGTWTANSDTTFTDNTTTTGSEQITLPAGCLLLSGTTTTCAKIVQEMRSTYDTVSCTDATGGGCTCSATVNQQGEMGLVVGSAAAQTSGNYTTSSNTIANSGDSNTYSYCVANNTLTVTPVDPFSATGTIVLQQGTAGTKGSGGAAGGGNGGSTGAAGTSATHAGGAGGTSGAGGVAASGGSYGGGGVAQRSSGPCDIYAAAKTPCAGAYSMVRALSSTYTGPLFQVRSGSSTTNTGTGGSTQDIAMTTDGYADTSSVDSFCSGTTCTVSKLYDQSGNANDLVTGTGGPAGNGTRSGDTDYESSITTKGQITAGGHKVYSLYMNEYEGYRTPLKAVGKGMPTGNAAEGIYELADGTHFGGACCWDFGDVSPDPNTYVTMNTIFFGTGYWGSGAGSGPWFMGDFEGGVWAGGSGASSANNPQSPSMAVPFALGILHTPVGQYELRMADVQKASDLTTAYNGTSPKGWGNAGGIGLGIGGDNSNNSYGTFYEGAITNGAPSEATDLLVMKNIQAVGYSK
ncbi:MAG: arabinofuranosidase catalytic domain-containing protein [Polyangia bacterium]